MILFALVPPLLAAPLALVGQWNAAEEGRIAAISRSVATVGEPLRPLGSAVLIGADGSFLVHRSVATGIGPEGVEGRLADGRSIRLFLVGRDVATQFALLQARPWTPGPPPARAVEGEIAVGRSLVAITGSRAFRAEVSRLDRVGVDTATRRMVPLTEVRFEAGAADVAGAALFTLDGAFVGCVTATLTPAAPEPMRLKPNLAPFADFAERPRVGPVGLVVGYATGPEVTRRAVEGFLSPARRPQVAAIGVLCRNAPGGGALVEAVEPGSPAAEAGLRSGDVIVRIGERPIGDQIAFARALYAIRPGEAVSFRVRRGSAVVNLAVTPGLAR